MKGVRPQTKTFETLQEAEDWIAVTEAQIRDGKFVDRRKAQKTSFATLLRRYEEEVAPTKRGGDTEIVRLRRTRGESSSRPNAPAPTARAPAPTTRWICLPGFTVSRPR